MMNKEKKLKAISSYVENGIRIDVYPEKKTKRNPYWSGGSLVLMSSLAKRQIPEDSGMAMPTRRKLK
jgi:hypothetical protein